MGRLSRVLRFPNRRGSFIPSRLSGLALHLDSDLGLTLREDASIEDDLTLWTSPGITVVGDALVADTTGSIQRRVYTFDLPNVVDGAQTVAFTVQHGTKRWVRFTVGATVEQYVDVVDGVAGNDTFRNCEVSIAPVGSAYRITVSFVAPKGGVSVYVVDANGGSNCTASDGDVLATLTDVELTQKGVTAWADQSGRTISGAPAPTDLVQGTAANQPQYLGPKQGIRFGGTKILASTGPLSRLRFLHRECTVFIACKRELSATIQYLYLTSGTSTSGLGVAAWVSANTTAVNNRVMNGSGSSYMYSAATPNGSFGSGKYILTTTLDSSNLRWRSNGNADQELAAGAAAPDADPNLQLSVGGYSTASFEGEIYEMIAYERVLNATEIAQVEAYLSSKWNIPFSISTLSSLSGLVAHWVAGLGYTLSSASVEEDLTAWTQTEATVSDHGDGVYEIVESDSASALHYISTSGVNTTSSPTTVTLLAKQGVGVRHLAVQVNDPTNPDPLVVYDLSSGTVNSTASGGSGTITGPDEDGWYTITFSVTPLNFGGWFLVLRDASFSATYTGNESSVYVKDVAIQQDRVQTWADQVGSYDLVQPTAGNQPTVVADHVVFDRNDLMTADALAALFSGTTKPVTFACAAEPSGVAGAPYSLGDVVSGSPYHTAYLPVNATTTTGYRRDDANVVTSNCDATTTGIARGTFVDAFDGVWRQIRYEEAAGISAQTGTLTLGQFTVGSFRRTGGSTNFWSGKMYEIGVWDRSLTTTEARLAAQYLSAKYGL